MLVSARAVHAVGSPEPPLAASPSTSPTGLSVTLLTHRTSTGEQLCRVQWTCLWKRGAPSLSPSSSGPLVTESVDLAEAQPG